MTTATKGKRFQAQAVRRGTAQVSVRVLAMQFVLMIVGFGLTLSAFGIWLVRGTEGAPELSLIKLGVSLFMLIAGMCLVVIAKSSSVSR